MNPANQVSSTEIIAQDGRVCRAVPLDKMAWCNGTTTAKTDNRYFGLSTVPEVLKQGGNVNQYSISYECEGYYSKTGGALTDAQLDTLAERIKANQAEVKELYGHTIPMTREYIVGHFEINPKTKPCCPGEKFSWDELIARLNGSASAKTLYRVQVGAFKSADYARAYVR